MSKLEELITELCPNGVQHKPLGEMVTIDRGTRVVRKQLSGNEGYPVYQNSIVPLGFHDLFNCKANSTFIIAAGAAGEIGYSYVDFWAADDCYYFCIDEASISNRFLFHVLVSKKQQISQMVRKAGVPRLARSSLSGVIVPFPPLPIQEEIVRILDSFTDLTEELSEELSEELAVRKRQYEYYRSYLFTTEKWNVPFKWHSIDSICKKITSGGTPSANTPSYYGGNIPWLRTQEINWGVITNTIVKITEQGLLNSSAKWIPPNCVIIAMYGATAGKVAINKIPLTTNQACCNLEIDEEIASYRYVFHWLAKEYINIKSLGQGSQSNINAKIVKDYEIPIPNIKVQNSIVNILDHFNTLSNDLTSEFNGAPRPLDLSKAYH